MPNKRPLPAELAPIRDAALRALAPIKPADVNTRAPDNFLFEAQRTSAGRQLPPYYLIYFLLVDLLHFRDLGQWEKVAWSIPIDFNGRAFLIEYRKFGVGVFALDLPADEEPAKEIVKRIQRAVKAARPFYDWLADDAVSRSAVNVLNRSRELFDRYKFLHALYCDKVGEAERRKDERVSHQEIGADGSEWKSVSFPAFRLRVEADWLSMSVVEAFFSWTEHVFIHLAIFLGRVSSAQDVTSLAEKDWADKFKAVLDVEEPNTKERFDLLLAIRREMRNFVAHGAFGKQGEAFTFHSGTGAVPVLLPHRKGSKQFSLGAGLEFDSARALRTIEEFTDFIWSKSRSPARLYIEESSLPTILTMAADGSYRAAMRSSESMTELVAHITRVHDNAANMDW